MMQMRVKKKKMKILYNQHLKRLTIKLVKRFLYMELIRGIDKYDFAGIIQLVIKGNKYEK